MPPLPIYKLPAARQEYKAEKVQPTTLNDCPVCDRRYGRKSNTADPTETPCDAVLLPSCNHIIGSTCLHARTRRGSTTCPLCSSPLAISDTPHPMPEWVCNIASLPLFQNHLDAITDFGKDLSQLVWFKLHTTHHESVMAELTEQIFAEPLSTRDAMVLWLHYIKLILLYNAVFHFLVSVPALAFWSALDWLYGDYIETLPLSVISGKGFTSTGSRGWTCALALQILIFPCFRGVGQYNPGDSIVWSCVEVKRLIWVRMAWLLLGVQELLLLPGFLLALFVGHLIFEVDADEEDEEDETLNMLTRSIAIMNGIWEMLEGMYLFVFLLE